jgi:hypothetical protein
MERWIDKTKALPMGRPMGCDYEEGTCCIPYGLGLVLPLELHLKMSLLSWQQCFRNTQSLSSGPTSHLLTQAHERLACLDGDGQGYPGVGNGTGMRVTLQGL